MENNIEIKRLDDLREAEVKRVNDHFILMAFYEDKLNIAEAKRLDSMRAVDVAAVVTANDKATAQATVLANNVTASAETLRALVATTAATNAKQLTDSTNLMTDRISALEKAQYENKGRDIVSTPALDLRLDSIEKTLADLGRIITNLQNAQNTQTGQSKGIGMSWMYLIQAVGFLSVIVSIFYALSK